MILECSFGFEDPVVENSLFYRCICDRYQCTIL